MNNSNFLTPILIVMALVIGAYAWVKYESEEVKVEQVLLETVCDDENDPAYGVAGCYKINESRQ